MAHGATGRFEVTACPSARRGPAARHRARPAAGQAPDDASTSSAACRRDGWRTGQHLADLTALPNLLSRLRSFTIIIHHRHSPEATEEKMMSPTVKVCQPPPLPRLLDPPPHLPRPPFRPLDRPCRRRWRCPHQRPLPRPVFRFCQAADQAPFLTADDLQTALPFLSPLSLAASSQPRTSADAPHIYYPPSARPT